jgi:hypothetical protein
MTLPVDLLKVTFHSWADFIVSPVQDAGADPDQSLGRIRYSALGSDGGEAATTPEAATTIVIALQVGKEAAGPTSCITSGCGSETETLNHGV